MSLPMIPDTGKITDGNDAMNETRTVLNGVKIDSDQNKADVTTLKTQMLGVQNDIASEKQRVQPTTLGGTGGTTRATARQGIGITSGTAAPSGGSDGDIYFQIVG